MPEPGKDCAGSQAGQRSSRGNVPIRSFGARGGMAAISDMLNGNGFDSSDEEEEEEGMGKGQAGSGGSSSSFMSPCAPNPSIYSPEIKPSASSYVKAPPAPSSSSYQQQQRQRASLSGMELPSWIHESPQPSTSGSGAPNVSDLLDKFVSEGDDGPIIRSRDYARMHSEGSNTGSPVQQKQCSGQQAMMHHSPLPPAGPGSRVIRRPLNASFASMEDSYALRRGDSSALFSRQSSGGERYDQASQPLAEGAHNPAPVAVPQQLQHDLRSAQSESSLQPLRDAAAALITWGGRPPRRPMVSPQPADTEPADESGSSSRRDSLSSRRETQSRLNLPLDWGVPGGVKPAATAFSPMTAFPPLARASSTGLPPAPPLPDNVARRVSFTQAPVGGGGGSFSRHSSPGRSALIGGYGGSVGEAAPPSTMTARDPSPLRGAPSLSAAAASSGASQSPVPRPMAPCDIVAAAVALVASGIPAQATRSIEEPELSAEPSMSGRPPRPLLNWRDNSPARLPTKSIPMEEPDPSHSAWIRGLSQASPLRASRDSTPLREMLAPREPPGSGGYLPNLPPGRLSRDASPASCRQPRSLPIGGRLSRDASPTTAPPVGRPSRDASPQVSRGLRSLTDDPSPARAALSHQDSAGSGSVSAAAPSNPLQDMPGWRMRLQQPPKALGRGQREVEPPPERGGLSGTLPKLSKAYVFIQPDTRFDLVPEQAD